MRILIAGASGLVGSVLTEALRSDGHEVIRLVRPGPTRLPGDISWDPMAATLDMQAMEGADAVVHLGGANIAGGRWSPERKAVLRASRVGTTRVLVDALANLRRKPSVFLCASATGYYGDRGDEVLRESSEPGVDFLALLARDWEAEAGRAELSGIRAAMLRFGIILSARGGALPRMATPFRFGVGGRLGTGNQWMSWIALEDVIDIIRLAIADGRFRGPLNIVSPNPVTNAEFTRAMAAGLGRPAIFRIPAFALRLALGEMADALLASQRVVPERLNAVGYSFRSPQLDEALRSILAKM